MAILKIANLILKFLLELCLMAAFGYWGYTMPAESWQKYLLSAGMIAIFVIIWAVFMAPRSKRRLGGLSYHLMDLVILVAAILGLVDAGQSTIAMVLAIVYLTNKMLIILWRQSPPPRED